jgi:DNA primase
MRAADLAARLRARKSGRSFLACCPAHNDRDPSLSITQGHSTILLHCFAGCDPADIIAAFRARGLWDEPERKRRRA